MRHPMRAIGLMALALCPAATVQAQLQFVPGTESKGDAPYTIRADGVGNLPRARFVDAEGRLIYGFRTQGLKRLALRAKLGNNFRVMVSIDQKSWRGILNGMAIHGEDRHNGRLDTYRVDLSAELPAPAVYILFGDASVIDGWGAYVAEVALASDAADGHDWVVPPPPPPPGMIKEWQILGSFPVKRSRLLEPPASLGDMTQLCPPAGGTWQMAQSPNGRIALRARALGFARQEDALAYAHVFVKSERETDACLLGGSDDALAVYVNGALVWQHEIFRGCQFDQDRVPVVLAKGWNRILLGVGNAGTGWGFVARLVQADGKPLAGIQVQANAPAELAGTTPNPQVAPRIELQSARLAPSAAYLDEGRLRAPLQVTLLNLGGKGTAPQTFALLHGAQTVQEWTIGPAPRGYHASELFLTPASWRVLTNASAPLTLGLADQRVPVVCPSLPRLLAVAGDVMRETRPKQARILLRLGLARRHWRKTHTPAPLWRTEAARWLALAQTGKWEELGKVAATFQEADGSRWSTSVQCAAPANPRYDIAPDAVMVYGGRDPAPRLRQWRRCGARVQIMTGIAWGNYQDYQEGRYDGKRHDDEIQTTKDGKPISHGGSVYYWVPTETYADYLCQRLAPALELPADGVCLEEPEFWLRGGWSPAFKREWSAHFGEPWQPPDSSPEARYRAWQLRRALYTRCLRQVAGFLKKRRPDWECIVATHSLINYTSWGIASPESALADIESCDTVIAQVWNDTILTPCIYDGKRASRPFATAYLEFAQMAGMIGATGRSLVFLADPVADNAQRSWEVCRRRYEETVVAGLFQGSVNRFELMPWPDRVFTRSRAGNSAESDETSTMPASYRTSLLAVCEALRNLPLGSKETSPIAVAVSDSMQAQAGFGDATGSADFFGQALPLVMRGLRPRVVHLEQVSNSAVLAGVRILLLSYNGQTPPDEKTHTALARWVRNGGVLLSLTDPDDPFQRVREWWNRPPHADRLPQQHLYTVLGLETTPATGWHSIGKGQIFVQPLAPRRLAAKRRHQELADWVAEAARRARVPIVPQPFSTIRRGPYVAATSFAEAPKPAPFALNGPHLDLLSDGLALVTNPVLSPGRCGLWVDLAQAPAAPSVLASASRIDGWSAKPRAIDFVSFAPEGGEVVTWLRLDGKPTAIHASQHNGVPVPVQTQWVAEQRCLRLQHPANPDGIWLHLDR